LDANELVARNYFFRIQKINTGKSRKKGRTGEGDLTQSCCSDSMPKIIPENKIVNQKYLLT
jgi:hypothetical protein